MTCYLHKHVIRSKRDEYYNAYKSIEHNSPLAGMLCQLMNHILDWEKFPKCVFDENEIEHDFKDLFQWWSEHKSIHLENNKALEDRLNNNGV